MDNVLFQRDIGKTQNLTGRNAFPSDRGYKNHSNLYFQIKLILKISDLFLK